MKFTLTIDLGNDAMQTGRDVADALLRVAHRIEDNTLPLGEQVATIRDENGNTVGGWGVLEGEM